MSSLLCLVPYPIHLYITDRHTHVENYHKKKIDKENALLSPRLQVLRAADTILDWSMVQEYISNHASNATMFQMHSYINNTIHMYMVLLDITSVLTLVVCRNNDTHFMHFTHLEKKMEKWVHAFITLMYCSYWLLCYLRLFILIAKFSFFRYQEIMSDLKLKW